MSSNSAKSDAMVALINSGEFCIRVSGIPFFTKDEGMVLASFILDSKYQYTEFVFTMDINGDTVEKREPMTTKTALRVFRYEGYDLQSLAREVYEIMSQIPF